MNAPAHDEQRAVNSALLAELVKASRCHTAVLERICNRIGGGPKDTLGDFYPTLPGPAAINRGNAQTIDRTNIGTGAAKGLVQYTQSFPGLATLCLFIERPAVLDDANAHGEPVARIRFGAGGVDNEAEVDFASGVQVVVPCEFASVAAFWDPAPAVPDNNDPSAWPRAVVGALGEPGVHPARVVPSRTFRRTIAPGASTRVLVPAYAREFRLFSASATAYAGTTEVLFEGGTTDGEDLFQVDGTRLLDGLVVGGGLAVPPNAVAVTVSNTNNEFGIDDAQLSFLLDL